MAARREGGGRPRGLSPWGIPRAPVPDLGGPVAGARPPRPRAVAGRLALAACACALWGAVQPAFAPQASSPWRGAPPARGAARPGHRSAARAKLPGGFGDEPREEEQVFEDIFDDGFGEAYGDDDDADLYPTKSIFAGSTVAKQPGVLESPDLDALASEPDSAEMGGAVNNAKLAEEEGSEVTDEEVDEFLSELTGKPIQKREEGTFLVDPMAKDMTKELDMFKELRTVPARQEIYDRGMPAASGTVTVKERMRMMAVYAEQGNWYQARWLLVGMWSKRRLRLPLGRMLWNLMIKAHARANRPLGAESWLKDMLDRIYQPDIVSYNTFLGCLGRRGMYMKAEEWIRRMRSRGVSPDVRSYTALANAYAEAENFDGMERTLYAIRDAKLPDLNAMPFNAALKMCSRRGLQRRAESLLSLMEEARVAPDRVSYLLFMKLCAKTRDTEAAVGWLLRMEDVGLQPGMEHLHAVMSAHARTGDMSGVEAWLQVMSDKGMTPDTYSYNIWLSAAATTGDTDSVERIVDAMKEAGLEPDVITYSTAIDVFAEAADAEGAKAWLLRAEAAGEEPDLLCYNRAIKACMRAGNADMADHLTRRLLRNRLTPDMYTYSVLLGAFAKDGKPAQAEFWADHMQRQARWSPLGFPAKEVAKVYGNVLLAHVRSGNLEAAEAWHSQMLLEGVEPVANNYAALAEGHLEEGRPAEARKWLERMVSWGSHRPPPGLVKELQALGEPVRELVEVPALRG